MQEKEQTAAGRLNEMNQKTKSKDAKTNSLREFFGDLRALPQVIKETKLHTFDLILLVLVLLFCLLTMFYADMTVTGPFGVMLWDSLFDGKFLSFYANCLESGIAPEGAVYDIGLYIVFAIWNLPIWILNKVAGLDFVSVFALLWYKILPTIYVLASVTLVRDIALKLELKEEEAGIAGILYLLSSMVVLPVFVTAQYDSIPLYFILKGVLCYVKDCKEDAEHKIKNKEKISKRPFCESYLFWLALSLIMKPMGILVLFLLILLKEKNLFAILWDMIKGCSLMLVCKGIYSLSPEFSSSAGGFLETHLPDLLQANFEGGYGEVSIFILALGLIYMMAYLYDWREKGALSNARMSIVYTFWVWAVFLAFGRMTPYWTIYLAPFLVLTILLCGKKKNEMLLIDWVGEICLSVVLILNFSWVYGGEKTFTYLLLRSLCADIISGERAVTVAGFLRQFHLDDFLPVLMAIVIAWLFITGWTAMKNCMKVTTDTENDRVLFLGRDVSILRGHIRIRILMALVWILMSLAAFYYMIN